MHADTHMCKYKEYKAESIHDMLKHKERAYSNSNKSKYITAKAEKMGQRNNHQINNTNGERLKL